MRIERLPVLLVVTFRPEFRPPWVGRAHVALLTLSRLGRSQAAEVVARVTDGRALPAEVLDPILAKTDGVPLFVEELTKAVLEVGLLRPEGERYVLRGPLPPLAIPDTLHGSLLARLDRLAPVKEVAQVAAVIGREFAHELLHRHIGERLVSFERFVHVRDVRLMVLGVMDLHRARVDVGLERGVVVR